MTPLLIFFFFLHSILGGLFIIYFLPDGGSISKIKANKFKLFLVFLLCGMPGWFGLITWGCEKIGSSNFKENFQNWLNK